MKKYFVSAAIWLRAKLSKFLETEQDRQFRASQKKLEARRKRVAQENQNRCPHVAGSLGEEYDVRGRTSIVWHTLNTNETVGICTGCFRNFFPSDPDYQEWFKKKSINTRSRAEYSSEAKAEPCLLRLSDPRSPLSISSATPFSKSTNQPIDKYADPWLLNYDGTPDPFVENVDFGFVYVEPEEGPMAQTGKEVVNV